MEKRVQYEHIYQPDRYHQFCWTYARRRRQLYTYAHAGRCKPPSRSVRQCVLNWVCVGYRSLAAAEHQ